MEIMGSVRATAEFSLIDNTLVIRQGEDEIVLTPEQAERLANFISADIEYQKKQWVTPGGQ